MHPLNPAFPADGASLPPRDSGRSAIESAPAGDRPGFGDRFEEVEEAYAGADRILAG
ncbi:pyruvate carboxylase domain protein [Mycobacterium kansasii 824]|nr:pyruvate carboxylase domain protein [Mycobacterium kansasii 824]